MVDITPTNPRKRPSLAPLTLIGLGLLVLVAAAYAAFWVLRFLIVETTWFVPLLLVVLKSLALMVGLLIFIAFILLADRKIWAAVQLRRGPNVVGPLGLLQSFADFLKFVLKEPVIPSGSDRFLFL
ncbi:MAG: NADH-quinone oxidoreductase subunit H, partial [Rhabdaerophilum calidifontis]